MNLTVISIEQAVYILGGFAVLDVVLILCLPLVRAVRKRRKKRRARTEQLLFRCGDVGDRTYKLDETAILRQPQSIFIPALLRVKLRVQLSQSLLHSTRRYLEKHRVPQRLRRMLRSPYAYRRRYAVLAAGVLPDEARVDVLLPVLQPGITSHLALRVSAQLLSISQPNLVRERGGEIIAAIHTAFRSAPELYRARVLSLLARHPEKLAFWMLQHGLPGDAWGARMAVQGLPALPRDRAEKAVRRFLGFQDPVLLESTVNMASTHFRSLLQRAEFADHPSPHVRSKRAAVLAETVDIQSEQFLELLRREDLNSQAVRLVQQRVSATERNAMLDRYTQARQGSNPRLRKNIARILEPHITFLLQRDETHRSGQLDPDLRQLVADLIASGRSSRIIRFLSSQLRQEDLSSWRIVVGQWRSWSANFDRECRTYLPERIRSGLDISPPNTKYTRATSRLKIRERLTLGFLAAGVVLAIPAAYLVQAGSAANVYQGVLFYQWVFGFYILAVNLSYSVMLLLSAVHLFRHRGDLDELELLFTPGMLPKVSILVPAYNEEKNIVESIRSLMALRYPSFEIVVVNDGSKDATLQTIIDAYHMTPTDMPLDSRLETAPVWGGYRSDDMPNLILIDKANGGKADSLNVGIRAASGEYICGIDADSILEQDALLELMRAPLDYDRETAAVGGNVLPINGSRVEHGAIQAYGFPRNQLARLQTIEYLRAFMAGRMGWAEAGALLIISGAFGAFRRSRILEIGGYLTVAGAYGKETVGEDMEVVVRLRRHLYDLGTAHTVEYRHTANCWTEVPEAPRDLAKQRDRWNRGLIEILMFHGALLLNRKAGAVGWLALPYFWIFEMLGPFLEALGYLAVIASLVFGFFHPAILILLLAVSIGYGVAISMITLYMSGDIIRHFGAGGTALLVLFSVLENFGYRQIVALQRAWSYLKYLFRNPGWQKMERRGFTRAQ